MGEKKGVFTAGDANEIMALATTDEDRLRRMRAKAESCIGIEPEAQRLLEGIASNVINNAPR